MFIAACIGFTGYLYVKGQKSSEVFKTDSVFVSDVYKKTIATGTIEARKEVLVKPQISGIIEKIYYKAGEVVKKGDIIAQIKLIPMMRSLNDAETQVNTARINFEQSELEYNRRKKLFEDKVIAQADFVTFQQDFRLRKEQLEAAENNLQLIKSGSSRRVTSTTTLVRATIDGKILDIPVKEGSYVIESNSFNDGTTVASLANMNDLIFKGKIPESEVAKLTEGMPLNLQIGALTSETFEATLEFISSKGVEDKGSIQFDIKAGISPSNAKRSTLRAGYSATADIILDKKLKVLIVKEKNIERKGDSTIVYFQTKPQEFEKRLIKTGISDDVNVEVVSGLKLNDRIKVLENK